MNFEVDPLKTSEEPQSLNEWTHVLCNEEMPIFSNTALNVNNILSDDRKGANELASVILQDPNLTVKVLKISNTPHYNPSRQQIVTVSLAIIKIGSEVIRQLTLLCSFFESILSSVNKHQANEEIANAIHAAMHAKSIAMALKDPSPEEVFIATLLNHIGSISFWCFCKGQGERIQALISKGILRGEAEKRVLGFKLTELSARLSVSWKLGGLIEESIKLGDASKNPRVGLVMLGYEITEALKEGVSSEKYQSCLRKIAVLTRLSKQEISDRLKKNTEIASDMANQFGATDAATLIQSNPADSEAPSPIFDRKQLQLNISQAITALITDQRDVNLLMETVIEGVYRGIGMDRAVFLLVASDKQSLQEKFSLGWQKKSYDQKVVFSLSDSPANLFYYALSGNQAFWAKPTVNFKLYKLQDMNVIGQNENFMMPIFSNRKTIGLIYADCAISGRELTEEDFVAFKHLCQQANIGIPYMQSRGKDSFLGG
jgi:HD-like signal output (HDOD) protein